MCAQLSEIMKSGDLLQIKYRIPSITAYNRLEPRPRSQNFERSLRAEIRDPLWMLTRQWQLGEFEGEDTGSAIDARLLTNKVKVDRISFDGQVGRPFNDGDLPMEAIVERETIVFDEKNLASTYGLRVQMGQYFLKLHSEPLRTTYMAQYLGIYGFAAHQEETFRGQIDGLGLYLSTYARSIDGGKIYKGIVDGSFAADISINSTDNDAFNEITKQFKKWFERQYTFPVSQQDTAWKPRTLDYRFSMAAPYLDGHQSVLEANGYYGNRLDWYSFDENPQANRLDMNSAAKETPEIISFLPTPAEFKGMPSPRFWEMEDRQIDFGKINAKTTDHLLLLFAEFGLIYGNDWSVIPYPMSVNTICEVKGLVITDVFGDRTLIPAANGGDENNWQRWSMFNLSNVGAIGSYNNQYFLPSTLTNSLQGEPIEQVNFIRDEMANMAWGIEDIIPDACSKGINGHEAADQTGVLPPPIAEADANSIRYLLGTTVPENWIPFLPVQKDNSSYGIIFQRAAMPDLGNLGREIVKAKGVLLNEAPTPYYISESEIPYSGTIVNRAFQRVRWYNGKTVLWLGRYRETGRGQGDSNLRFDQIEPGKQG